MQRSLSLLPCSRNRVPGVHFSFGFRLENLNPHTRLPVWQWLGSVLINCSATGHCGERQAWQSVAAQVAGTCLGSQCGTLFIRQARFRFDRLPAAGGLTAVELSSRHHICAGRASWAIITIVDLSPAMTAPTHNGKHDTWSLGRLVKRSRACCRIPCDPGPVAAWRLKLEMSPRLITQV